MRRFYGDFAACYGTCWLILFGLALVTSSRIDAGVFGALGFPALALLYALFAASVRAAPADEAAFLRHEVESLRRELAARQSAATPPLA
jgi:hypothetical protein